MLTIKQIDDKYKWDGTFPIPEVDNDILRGQKLIIFGEPQEPSVINYTELDNEFIMELI